jgi:hypothetical protein
LSGTATGSPGAFGSLLALSLIVACTTSDRGTPGAEESGGQWTACATLTYDAPIKAWSNGKRIETATATDSNVEYRIISRSPLTIETRASAREVTYSLFGRKKSERETLMTFQTKGVSDLKCSTSSADDNKAKP